VLSIGIVWNCANFLNKEIIRDVDERTSILESIELDLGDKYEDFVRAIYSSEQMEEWKIENKISHMMSNSCRKITILFFEFDDTEIEYHPFKKKNVFKQLESCKMHIREKYKSCIDNYIFDIVFHATDNLIELKNCFNILLSFIENNNELQKESTNKLLRMRIHKSINNDGDKR